MIKVSIIVPVYNVESYLRKCLNTLVKQTLEDIEIILIDDGSTDNSLNIIKEYHEKYPEKIVFKSVENNGAAKARNIALKMARGEYIGFVDSDDYVDLTMFEKMYNYGINQEAEIVTCGYNRINMKDVQRRDVRERECFGYNVFQAPQLFINNVPYIWNKLFKRSLIVENEIVFEDLRIFEDLVFTYKLFLKANKIVRIPETLYNYIFLREDSLTYAFGEKRFDLFKAFDSLIKFFEDNKAFYHFEAEILFILLNHIFVVCGNDVMYKDIPLKYKFINKGFEYLNDKFPYWKTTDLYFKKYKKNRFLFTQKTYWRLRTLVPIPVKRWWQNLVSMKRRLKYNRTGARFASAYAHQPLNEKRILLNSQQGNNLNGNMFYILKHLCTHSEFENFEIGVAYKQAKENDFIMLMERYGLKRSNVKLLKVNSKEYAQYLATAKYLFNDTSFPVYFIKREGQIYLNTWHGTPLKTLGRSTAEDYYDIANLQKNFMAADYLLYPSEYMKKHMLKDYMLTDIFQNQILLSGYPRNEIFFDKEREKIVRAENNMENKQCIAYMPTWRGNVRMVNKRQRDHIINYLQKIDQKLNDDQVMYVNLHPYVENTVKYNQFLHIKAFPKEYETYDFLNACDLLITDYSSVFFDYAVSGKKIILFTYDEEEYFKNRGVYLKLEDLPFVKVKTVEKLIKEIHNPKIQNRTEFLKEYCLYEDEKISEKICNQIILGKPEKLVVVKHETGKNDNVMFYMKSLRSDRSLGKFQEVLEKSKLDDRNYYFTYNTADLMGREKYILDFPEKLMYFGKLNPYSASKLLQSFVLYKIEKHKIYYSLFGKTLRKAYLKEKCRAFVDAEFKYNVIWGKEEVKTIGYVSEMDGIKVMYLQSTKDINEKVPSFVYEKYDYIITETNEVKEKLQMISRNVNVVVKKIEKLEDVIE